eukprot:scaffold5977_cov103-Isochrysis_galbana.AAC.7
MCWPSRVRERRYSPATVGAYCTEYAPSAMSATVAGAAAGPMSDDSNTSPPCRRARSARHSVIEPAVRRREETQAGARVRRRRRHAQRKRRPTQRLVREADPQCERARGGGCELTLEHAAIPDIDPAAGTPVEACQRERTLATPPAATAPITGTRGGLSGGRAACPGVRRSQLHVEGDQLRLAHTAGVAEGVERPDPKRGRHARHSARQRFPANVAPRPIELRRHALDTEGGAHQRLDSVRTAHVHLIPPGYRQPQRDRLHAVLPVDAPDARLRRPIHPNPKGFARLPAWSLATKSKPALAPARTRDGAPRTSDSAGAMAPCAAQAVKGEPGSTTRPDSTSSEIECTGTSGPRKLNLYAASGARPHGAPFTSRAWTVNSAGTRSRAADKPAPVTSEEAAWGTPGGGGRPSPSASAGKKELRRGEAAGAATPATEPRRGVAAELPNSTEPEYDEAAAGSTEPRRDGVAAAG